MKKALLIILLLFLVIAGIFYKQILDTVDFYIFQSKNVEVFEAATLDWKNIPFTSVTSSGLAEDSLTFDSLHFPIPFPATNTSGEDSAFALGGSKSIAITRTSEAQDFLSEHSFTGKTREALCDFLTQTSSRGACVSNYSLYSAILELNKSDIHAFAPIADKNFYNELMMIRADMLPSQTISGFETSRFQGFLFVVDQNNHVAKLFDQQDQQYEITFSNLPESDVAFVLSNMSVLR